MLSNDTLDRIIFLFGIKMSQYNFIEDPTFVYKGRLLIINDTLPDDNNPELLELTIQINKECIQGNAVKYERAYINQDYNLMDEIKGEQLSMANLIYDLTEKLKEIRNEPYTKADEQRLKAEVRYMANEPIVTPKNVILPCTPEETQRAIDLSNHHRGVISDILYREFGHRRSSKYISNTFLTMRKRGVKIEKKIDWSEDELKIMMANPKATTHSVRGLLMSAGYSKSPKYVKEKLAEIRGGNENE